MSSIAYVGLCTCAFASLFPDKLKLWGLLHGQVALDCSLQLTPQYCCSKAPQDAVLGSDLGTFRHS